MHALITIAIHLYNIQYLLLTSICA